MISLQSSADIIKEFKIKFPYILSGFVVVEVFPDELATLIKIFGPVFVVMERTICLVLKLKSGESNLLGCALIFGADEIVVDFFSSDFTSLSSKQAKIWKNDRIFFGTLSVCHSFLFAYLLSDEFNMLQSGNGAINLDRTSHIDEQLHTGVETFFAFHDNERRRNASVGMRISVFGFDEPELTGSVIF